LVINLEFC